MTAKKKGVGRMEVMLHIAVTEVLLVEKCGQLHAPGTLQLGKRSPVPSVLDVG
jgi:hypothetical protein